MPEDTTATAEPTTAETPPTFSQADVDRIVSDRLKRERDKLAEKQAETARTAEQRIADLEKRLADADAREQRTRLVQTVAQQHGITDPEDVRLFLTGTDEDTLTAQAKRLAGRQAEQRKKGDVMPTEGTTPNNPADSDMREFARQLFDKE